MSALADSSSLESRPGHREYYKRSCTEAAKLKDQSGRITQRSCKEVWYLHMCVHKSTTPDNKVSDAASSAW
eukprot:1482116-Pyramimonas_sp.AAC.1